MSSPKPVTPLKKMIQNDGKKRPYMNEMGTWSSPESVSGSPDKTSFSSSYLQTDEKTSETITTTYTTMSTSQVDGTEVISETMVDLDIIINARKAELERRRRLHAERLSSMKSNFVDEANKGYIYNQSRINNITSHYTTYY